MANDSTQAGFLVPTATSPPLEDAALDAVFQQMVVGLTGLPGNLVRPRWQPTVPQQPEPSVSWCAIGVTLSDPDVNPEMWHNSAGDGSDTLLRNEVLTVLLSFYGPNAGANAAQARDGIFVSQNQAFLTSYSMGLLEVGKKRAVPELVNQQWVRRFDLDMTVKREIVRTYNVLNILSVEGTVDADTYTQPFSVSQ